MQQRKYLTDPLTNENFAEGWINKSRKTFNWPELKFMLQSCMILLRLWSMQFCDDYYS